MSILEQAFRNELIETLNTKEITINDENVITRIVDVLVTESDDMWDYIIAHMLNVTADVLSAHLKGTL